MDRHRKAQQDNPGFEFLTHQQKFLSDVGGADSNCYQHSIFGLFPCVSSGGDLPNNRKNQEQI